MCMATFFVQVFMIKKKKTYMAEQSQENRHYTVEISKDNIFVR